MVLILGVFLGVPICRFNPSLTSKTSGVLRAISSTKKRFQPDAPRGSTALCMTNRHQLHIVIVANAHGCTHGLFGLPIF